MELLLALLSLLTAATGVAGARVPETGVQQVAGMVAVAPSRQAAHRPVAMSATPAPLLADDPAPRADAAPATGAPRYADRRRE